MKPLIEIHRVGPDGYSYRVSARGAEPQEAGSTFESLERCLFDAGRALGQYFSRVEVNFEGLFVGSCATDSLRRNPKGVAQRISRLFLPA